MSVVVWVFFFRNLIAYLLFVPTDRQDWTNSVDPDQTPQITSSDLSLLWSPCDFLTHEHVVKCTGLNFMTNVCTRI